MTDPYTTITLPGTRAGFTMLDTVPAKEIIERIRAHAAEEKRKAEAVLSASDEDFHIITHRGLHVRRNERVVQEGRKP